MEITAQLKNLRISTRKARLTANLLKGLTALQAERQLRFLTKRSALPLEKLLKSAIANAENNAHLVKDNLYISRIVVDQGPTMKRWRARARGQAAEILKRTSHIKLVLSEIAPGKRLAKRQEKESGKKAELAEKSGDEKKRGRRPSPKDYVKPEERKMLSQQKAGGIKRIFRRKSI